MGIPGCSEVLLTLATQTVSLPNFVSSLGLGRRLLVTLCYHFPLAITSLVLLSPTGEQTQDQASCGPSFPPTPSVPVPASPRRSLGSTPRSAAWHRMQHLPWAGGWPPWGLQLHSRLPRVLVLRLYQEHCVLCLKTADSRDWFILQWDGKSHTSCSDTACRGLINS